MTMNRGGFTLLEMLMVLVIGGMMLAVGTREYSSLSNERAVRNAGNALVHTSNRARSEAMRSGQLIFLQVRPAQNLVRVADGDDKILHTLDVDDYGASLIGSEFTVCYAARGYALPGCTTISSIETVRFARGGDTAIVRVLPLGQVRRAE